MASQKRSRLSIASSPSAAELKDTNLENQFLKDAGASTLDVFDHSTPSESVAQPLITSKPMISSAPVPQKELAKSTADADERPPISSASDILTPFVGIHITYAPKMKLSNYVPCSYMMDYVVHQMNYNLVDNFYFKRHAPDYHPYVLRLYYAILFWIQCLRAANTVCALEPDQHQLLSHFLDAYPPESLPVAGPLIPLFKTLCSSQPEFSTYGAIYPRIPVRAGPRRRHQFVRDNTASFSLPNVPGIFALLEHLNTLINGLQPLYPRKGAHTPVAEAAATFGHHAFPARPDRSPLESWSLCTSGLQHPCEADARLNEAFAERYANFDFPVTAANDNTSQLRQFLGFRHQLAWFAQVKNVAASASTFFTGSGYLSDCSPSGLVSNQIVVQYIAPHVLPTVPTKVADKNSLFPFSFRLFTTARGLPALSECMAAMAQTNVQMFYTHPYLSALGLGTRTGDFWDIAPIEYSSIDSSSYLAINDRVKMMMKSKIN
uniref:Coat protein n=1 Tax=String-of-pearls partitivirus TaxID=2933099 RepID=A0A9C7GWN6_9VIRU|nr:putative coat protein [String-of-pearls partitivirus]CAI5383978.1 putative coat protein [String-of-pearls partitivirus]